MPSSLEIYERFDEIKNAKNDEERKELLKRYIHTDQTFKRVINGAMHSSIKFLIPNGFPPYHFVDPGEDRIIRIEDFMRNIYLWVEGSRRTPPEFTQAARDKKLEELLTAMKEKEAMVLEAMFKKNLTSYKITRELVESVAPELVR